VNTGTELQDRLHERAPLDCPVEFGYEGQTFAGKVCEIGEGGFRLETAAPLREGAGLRLTLSLDRWADCQLGGHVVRRRGLEAGVAFDRLRPREMLLIRPLVWRARR